MRKPNLKKAKNFFKKKGIDKPILLATCVLVAFGIVMIGSASVGQVAQNTTMFAVKKMVLQTLYAIGGLVIMSALTKWFRTEFINYKVSLVLFVIGIVSMCICILWSSKGSHAWIKLGPITIQPAEFMKVAMVLILSYMFTETDSAFIVKGRFRTAELKKKFYLEKAKRCFLLPVGLILIAFFVGVVIQKDLGTSLILATMCMICFLVTPRRYYRKYKRWFMLAAIVVVVGLVFIGTFFLKPYQIARIQSWLKPLENIYTNSWQLVNALIAFAGGGIFGKGFGNSIQKFSYIPEVQNDFIGAIIYEELGIFGLALIIIPTSVIIFRMLKYADEIQDGKSRVILIGLSSYFLLHLLVNLGGVSGLIPMTGVPILMISAGGSSTLSALIAIGIAQAIISRYNKSKLDTQD